MPNLNRFIRTGQNTPLTCVFMSGFEFNDQARDKIQSAASYTNQASSPAPHQNATYGGSRYGKLTTVTGMYWLGMPQLREYVICTAINLPTTLDTGALDTYDSGNATFQAGLTFTGTTGTINLRRAIFTSLGASTPSAFSTNAWNWVHWWGAIDDSAGFAHVRVGSYANEVLSVTGIDTKASTGAYFDTCRLATNSSSIAYFDDFMVFARSMYYSGASGTVPSPGATITGGTSGATAIITHVFDNGAGAGCFFVRTVSGTFSASESISQGGWSGTAGNALGNNEASLWVREQYIILATTDSDISTGWSNTTSGGASHYTEIDDAATTTDYVSTNTDSQVDEYGTSITLPPGAEIEAVCVSAYSRLNGVSAVNNIRVGVDDGATNVDADEDSALSGSWEVHDLILTRNPNTGTRYTTTEIGNLNIRITSKT